MTRTIARQTFAAMHSTSARYFAQNKPCGYDHPKKKSRQDDRQTRHETRQTTQTVPLAWVCISSCGTDTGDVDRLYTDKDPSMLSGYGRSRARLTGGPWRRTGYPWRIERCRILRQNLSAVGFYHFMTLGNGLVV